MTTEIIIPLSSAIALGTFMGVFFFYPVMRMERHLAEIVALVKNCPYCMRYRTPETIET